MNTYRTKFFARCPINGVRIEYLLEIVTTEVIRVENILEEVESIRSGFHEAIADRIAARFGGQQTIVAEHHGVTIETHRQSPTTEQYLDTRVGGMAGTPGY